MSVLVLLLPSRSASGAGVPMPGPAGGGDGVAAEEWNWVLAVDGQGVVGRGRGGAATLPACDRLVVAVEPGALGWHRLELPRVAPARLRAALDGLLEEVLLDEPTLLHMAMEPGAAPGQTAWVAVLRRGRLAGVLAALEVAGRDIDRVVPLWPPGLARRGHFCDGGDAGGQARLDWSAPDGAMVLPLRGAAARALTGADASVQAAVQWSASPAVVALAEQWLGAPVPLLDEAERALLAADSPWELRQFDLAPRRRGARRAAAVWRTWLSPAWRPTRLGLASLLALHVLGLNAWAWQQQRAIVERQQAQQALLRSVHPQVRMVIDPPLQMQRETALLRARAGQAGDADLEAALAAVAAAWPEGQPPAQGLRFETGRLVLTAAAWSDAQQRGFRERLRPLGWSADFGAGRLTLTRATAAQAGG